MSDLISRADAIEAVCGKCSTETRMECALNGYFCCDRRELEALPSADIERIEYDDRVELSVSNREKDKVILKDAFGSMEYVPSADAVNREKYDKLIQELNDSPKGKWIPLDGKLPKIIGEHVLVTIKWADDDLEVCEMCPTVADRYNIIAFQQMPLPYDGEPLKSELQCSGARMKGGAG